MASEALEDDPTVITVKVEYRRTPPQVFVAGLNHYIRENQPPNFTARLRWVKVAENEPQTPSAETQLYGSDDAFPSHPNGYRQSRACPVLRGQNFCPHCLCSPCVIALPPEFLRGYCSPHPANDEKRYRLYRLFWALLSTLGVWRDEEYLQMKESRTSRDDRREIIPKCIITEVRRRYPSFDGQYRDYMSTFEAESAVE